MGYKLCDDLSTPCEVYLQETVKPDASYFVFCCGFAYRPNFADTIHFPVEPQCKSRSDCGLEVHSKAIAGPDLQQKFGVEDLAAVFLLMVYICWSALFKYVRIIHETGMAVLAGIVLGFILRYAANAGVFFSYSIFSYMVLPCVIFNAGFNLQKKQFFRYSAYILALGVLGTVIIFFTLFFLAIFFFHVCPPASTFGTELAMTEHHMLIMAAVLASTDTVAPMAFLSPELYPKLFAVIFGEGVLNDVVSVLLCTAADGSTTRPPIGALMVDVLYFMATSCAMGLLFGLVLSYALKIAHDRGASILQEGDGLKALLLIIGVNYTCYIATELCEFSSIFALFVSALVSGHYSIYALKQRGRDFAREFAEVLAFSAEAFVYGYFGLTSVRFLHDTTKQSASLVCFYVVAIMLARVFSLSMVMLFLRSATCWHPLKLSLPELGIVAVAGSMRGTIAFALILHAAGPEELQTDVETIMVSTVLFVVLIDTLVLGPLFPVLLRLAGLAHGEGIPSVLSEMLEPCVRPDRIRDIRARHLRNTLHGFWKYVDAKYMKPTFRAMSQEDLEQVDDELEPENSQVGATDVQEFGIQTSLSPPHLQAVVRGGSQGMLSGKHDNSGKASEGLSEFVAMPADTETAAAPPETELVPAETPVEPAGCLEEEQAADPFDPPCGREVGDAAEEAASTDVEKGN